ncbi:zinc finger protein 761-like [Ochlerotatus camptorhynchus]|uniref:zinc finger protein 761-like n=1 Tax=Ochlerotatus camptorhynchus TaxID=644619 RepID=UPI0031D47F28
MSALDVERICRLCCTIKCRMRPLFEQRQEYPLSLRQMIYAIAQLEVDPNDGMPQKICSLCVTSLMKMYNTIVNYRENDLKLRKQFNRPTQEDTVQVEENYLKQEVVEDDGSGSKPLKQDAAAAADDDDGSRSTELNIRIKNEPLDEHDEESQATVTTQMVTVHNWKPTAVQGREPIPKPKRGRPRSKVEDPNRPKLHDYKCYICKSESHGTAAALLAHLNSEHKDLLPFTCSECVMETVVLKTLLTLNVHLRQHLNPEKCPYCDKRYITQYKVAIHIQQQHGSIEDDNAQCPTKCDHCDEEYPSKVSLMQHVKRVHTAPAPVSCVVCGEVFHGRAKLRSHIQRQHGQSKKFECNICQKKLTSLKILQCHLQTFHSNSSHQFKCSYCPKTYSTKSSKRAHERRHTRNPNYKAKQNWTQYYTPLEGEEGLKKKKCKCHICGKITRKITEHLRSIHFPVKFGCEICGKSFKLKNNYQHHLTTHEYGKSHQCPICKRTFANKRQLVHHKRTKHRDQPFRRTRSLIGLETEQGNDDKPEEQRSCKVEEVEADAEVR